MSRTAPSDFDSIALEIPCAYCLAPAGTWCSTSSGRWAGWLHSARTLPVYLAYRLGSDETEESLLHAAAHGDEWDTPWFQRKLAEHTRTCTR